MHGRIRAYSRADVLLLVGSGLMFLVAGVIVGAAARAIASDTDSAAKDAANPPSQVAAAASDNTASQP